MKTTHGVKAGVILWIAVLLFGCAATEDVRILDRENRQNASQLNKLQKDMEALVPQILKKPQSEIQHTLEMLVRAYDPCVSCSTHFLKVTFK